MKANACLHTCSFHNFHSRARRRWVQGVCSFPPAPRRYLTIDHVSTPLRRPWPLPPGRPTLFKKSSWLKHSYMSGVSAEYRRAVAAAASEAARVTNRLVERNSFPVRLSARLSLVCLPVCASHSLSVWVMWTEPSICGNMAAFAASQMLHLCPHSFQLVHLVRRHCGSRTSTEN